MSVLTVSFYYPQNRHEIYLAHDLWDGLKSPRRVQATATPATGPRDPACLTATVAPLGAALASPEVVMQPDVTPPRTKTRTPPSMHDRIEQIPKRERKKRGRIEKTMNVE